MSIDRFVPRSHGDTELDLLNERGLTPEELGSRLATLASYHVTAEFSLDESGRSEDCDYPDEVGPGDLPLGDL